MSFYESSARPRMNEETLERMVRTYMQTAQPQYSFGWQGGEPTLMGVDFFRKAVEFQQKYGARGAMVGNGLQTNGTLIDDELAAFLAEYQFLVGVSLDGPPDIHDRHRLTAGGKGTHAKVLQGIEKLKSHRVEYNILTLVNEANVERGEDVYRYLCDRGFHHHQYIPCVETGDNREVLPFSISGPQWGEFLCTIFDLWYPNDTRRVSIRLFDSVLELLVNGRRNICHMGTNCCQYFVVEYNGDVYPCDFFVEKQLRLGNVMDDSWANLQRSPVYIDFGSKKRQWPAECNDCPVNWLCAGDCLKHRFAEHGGDPHRLSHLCEGWKLFYEHTLPRFRRLAEEVVTEQRRAAAPAPRARRGKIGRNDPCPCGSGRKYKKCCGRRR